MFIFTNTSGKSPTEPLTQSENHLTASLSNKHIKTPTLPWGLSFFTYGERNDTLMAVHVAFPLNLTIITTLPVFTSKL